MTKRIPATKPSKSKRRKSAGTKPTPREPTPDEALYDIRDILEEKHESGRLLYRVDWADNPTTGEEYDPTWEPAENVTEAAVADWEKEKRRRQGIESQSSNPTLESDSQPVLPPNWRAKRKRETTGELERAHKRPRRSVDSGYTSTDGDGEASWSHVQSVPQNKGELVLEISRRAGFDPSEYLVISSSQSAPSSQAVPLDVAASQEKIGNQISQRTIPDSQDCFDSLRTQSTAQSVANTAHSCFSQRVSLPAPEGGSATQGADQEPQASDAGGQTSRSDFDIPSRQPEDSHHDFRRSFGLLETRDAQGTSHDLLSRPTSSGFELGGQGIPSEDSPWGEGFLTQPDFETPVSVDEAETSSKEQPLRSNQGLSQHSHQEHEPSRASNRGFRHDPFLSAAESHLHSQAAQEVSLRACNPGLLTQVSEGLTQSVSDIVPETVQRPRRRRSPSEPRDHNGDSPQSRGASHPSTPAARERATPPPVTPENQGMDGSGEGTTRPSAKERMRMLHAQVFNLSENGAEPALVSPSAVLQPALVSPSAVLPPMGNFAQQLEAAAAPVDLAALETSSREPPSVVEELNTHSMGFSMPVEDAAIGGHSMAFEQPPATVAPADLTTSIELLSSALGDPSTGDQILGVEESAQLPEDVDPDQFPLDMGADEQGRHFTVTLPMAANARATYLETFSENKATMYKFGLLFASSCPSIPDSSLVAKLDALFERLLNLCDLPAYDDDLPELGKEEMMKHATNSNSKLSFVYEFLHGLWDINAHILILSQPGRVFEYLEAVISATDCSYTILGQEGSTGQSTEGEGTSVILAVVGQDLSQIPGGVDVVIAYDHVARSVKLPPTLSYDFMAPIVLSLVATYSLDHIHQQVLQVEQYVDAFERRNALNLAAGKAIEYLRNPERQYIEPHEAAKTFANFLRNPELGLDWEPHPLSAEILEVWLSSQERTQQSQDRQADAANDPGGRKRPLDIVDEGTPKRPRLLDSQQPSRNPTPARLSDLLKQTLANHTVDDRSTTQAIEVPVEQLERMSDKIAELEGQLATQSAVESKMREHFASLESQLRSHERTVQSLQPKYMDALRDRSTFEKQCQKAVETASTATERLEVQKTEVATLKEKNKLLEARLAEANDTLANSTIPEIAKVTQAEKERMEALAAVGKAEKKTRSVENEVEYSRRAYQDASNAHTELNQENRELKAKVADLERRASQNLLKIHQIHAQNEMIEVNRQIDELQATLDNRERDLERAKEELKFLKNGRRETRQASVPRSPRTGVISPRPARGMGGAGSRGTSPAPLLSSDGPGVGSGSTSVAGMTFLPSVGNGSRWGHLRD
ncbi:hypothetical protein C8A00DRAFT_12578 [Chaetomidium leptoderma]|uniref:Chromo domain-containing protein n=1 Tax=Chaetomidium leptoderma TaxID=669021 RepID=A0AAN6VUI4_9PEZI|nr:hypothetical protein C8A00DRAFT_12578 [Chaetomidium leptoderma]